MKITCDDPDDDRSLPDCSAAVCRVRPELCARRSNSIPSPTRFSCPPVFISAKWPASRPIPRAIFSSTRARGIPRSRSAPCGRSRTAARGCSSSIAPASIVREIGKDTYGFMAAAQVRIDPPDNIWAVDEMSNMVMKFDPQGRVADAAWAQGGSGASPARSCERTMARDSPPICSTGRPMWRGTPQAISSWPMALATRASPSSIKTANS